MFRVFGEGHAAEGKGAEPWRCPTAGPGASTERQMLSPQCWEHKGRWKAWQHGMAPCPRAKRPGGRRVTTKVRWWPGHQLCRS